jgi:hypothetical protein
MLQFLHLSDQTTTVFCYVVLAVLVLAQAQSSGYDHYGTKNAIRRQNVKGDVLSFWGNATNIMSLFVANTCVAIIVGNHASSWSIRGFMVIFGAIAVGQAFGAIIPLLKDSHTTYSAFYRKGLLALSGAMQYQLFNIQTSVVAAFYLLTPPAQVTQQEVLGLTFFLLVNWVVSTLQPPLKAHGKLNTPAVAAATAGTAALIVGAAYLLVFARFINP